MKPIKYIFAFFVALTSNFATANENLYLLIEYRHDSLHVRYALPCSFDAACSLRSLENADFPWHIEVTPKKLTNGIVSLKTVVLENSLEVSRSEILNKIGESATISAANQKGSLVELSVKPYYKAEN